MSLAPPACWTLRIVLVLALGTLSACGWRLQGAVQLPEVMAVTYIEADDRYTPFHRALRESLMASGARITQERRQATAIIHIETDRSGQRVLSVSARNTPEEFEVFYGVEFSVSAEGKSLIEPEELELTRDYSYEETAVLAKQREQSILKDALARELASLVIRQLAAL